MKKLIIQIIFLFILSFTVNAQRVVGTNPAMQRFYAKVNNYFEIAVTEYSCSDIFINVNHGRVSGEGCKYKINPQKTDQIRIDVYILDSTGNYCFLEQLIFWASPLPDPFVYVYGIECSSCERAIFKNILIALGAVSCGLPAPGHVYVINYKVEVMRDNMMIHSCCCIGPYYSEELKQILNTIQSGDIVIFDEIEVSMPDHSKKTIGPIRYIIK